MSNQYIKYCPHVYLALCQEPHEKGDEIEVETRNGGIHECIIHNLIAQNTRGYFYSVTRSDGYNSQEHAKKRAERLAGYQQNAENRAKNFYGASNKDSGFLSLGEPIKVGHHSEKKHRRIIEQRNDNTRKWIQEEDKAASYDSKIEYWESKAEEINLSMPESLVYYERKLIPLVEKHKALKENKALREHSYSLTYAKNDVKTCEKNLALAKKLWGE
jgi:hypothetical protein